MRWRSAPHARFPIARRQVKMTPAGTFPFRAGSARGRSTCAHGRRSRGKRRTRFCSWARRASPCGLSRRMSPRRQTIPRLWRSTRRGALPSRFCRGIWAVRTSWRKLWHAWQGPSPSSPRRLTSTACGRWIRGRAVRGSPFRIPRPSSECRRGCFRAGAWRSIPTCRFRDSRLRGLTLRQTALGPISSCRRSLARTQVRPFARRRQRARSCPPVRRGSRREPLRLVVPCIVAGIGCRRGACAEAIGEAFLLACGQAGISPSAVREAATIDVKAHEEGLLAFCRARNIPLATYSAEELSQVEGSVSPSDFVRATVGVDNVCERAALADGGKLIFPKLAHGGVTVAFSKVTIELSFKER